MNTETISKTPVVAKLGTSNPLVTTLWRATSGGMSVGLFIYLQSYYAPLSWVKSLSQSRNTQMAEVDKRLDALESDNNYLRGKLGMPPRLETRSTINTNTP